MPSQREVTPLLVAWRQGDEAALNRLIPIVYGELRRLAHRAMRAHPLEQTLQTTALVNEAYLRLAGAEPALCQDRAHFLAICAQLMRNILVDFARARCAQKRGGGAGPIHLDEALRVAVAAPADLLRIDDALTALAQIDPRKNKAIELRFFGGLSVEETAEVLGVSRETVLRDWRLARAWLRSEVTRRAGHG